MLPFWVNGRLPVPRAEVDPLELVRAIECDDCWDRVLVRAGTSIRSYSSLERGQVIDPGGVPTESCRAMVVPLLDMLRGTLL
jgi:hypothetical protein